MSTSIDFNALVEKYQTPLYVYDFNHMKVQYESLKAAFKARKSILAYAVKANSNLSVIQNFAKMGAGADCVSIGEVRRALLAGIPKYKILFSGVGKRDDEIKEALEADILYINVESDQELLRVEMIAKELIFKHELVSVLIQILIQKHILISQQVFMIINLVLIFQQQNECTFDQKTQRT